MIAVKSLVKTFGLKPVLRGVNLTVAEGDFVAVLGANGAGKTTLLRILATLSKPTAGAVTVAGLALPQNAHAVRAVLGLVSHQPMLYGDLTAEENLRFFATLYALPAPHAPRLAEVLEQVGLAHRRHDFVRTFSRGMQQRLAIARAIVPNPAVMLFDEPHTGLDQQACAMLDGLLSEVAARGRTVLMTTHDLPRAHALARRVVVLARGKIAFEARTADLTLPDLLATYSRVVTA